MNYIEKSVFVDKRLDFEWLFKHFKQGSLSEVLKTMDINMLSQIHQLIDYEKQQMVKAYNESPELRIRDNDVLQGLIDCSKIVQDVINEKGPKQE
jgi:hypothetical protein